MRGIILAGGSGTRLRPLTNTLNKHLLPVYDKQMILYPLKTLVDGGIIDICIVTNKQYAGQFAELIGSGKEYGANVTYRIQEDADGTAGAIIAGKDFVKNEKEFTIILGDNIFFKKVLHQKFEMYYPRMYLIEVPDPERFGVAEVDNVTMKIKKLVEKPKNPKTNLAVTGLYVFDKRIFKVLDNLKPSKRGELEITDLCNFYINKNLMNFSYVPGDWIDAGTLDSLIDATNKIQSTKRC